MYVYCEAEESVCECVSLERDRHRPKFTHIHAYKTHHHHHHHRHTTLNDNNFTQSSGSSNNFFLIFHGLAFLSIWSFLFSLGVPQRCILGAVNLAIFTLEVSLANFLSLADFTFEVPSANFSLGQLGNFHP